jgi:cytochrome P450
VDASDIDLISAAAFAHGHPWDQYAWLREHAPVFRHPYPQGQEFWALTKYDDIRMVSRHPRLFSSYAQGTRSTTRTRWASCNRVDDLAREIVDDIIERGECDLVADVAGRPPSGLLAELMGIPRTDGEHLYELTELHAHHR